MQCSPHTQKGVRWQVAQVGAGTPRKDPGVPRPPRVLGRVRAPHSAKVVKKMCILARKVVTEPCRQSFISTSRAKSRGSRTKRCR